VDGDGDYECEVETRKKPDVEDAARYIECSSKAFQPKVSNKRACIEPEAFR